MKKLIFLLVLGCICILNLHSVYHKVNDLYTNTNYPKMEIVGNLAYVADHSYGLRVYDITDPVNPLLINSLALSHPIREILIAQPTAYLVCYDNVMYILDIQDISSPTILSQYYTLYPCVDVSVNNRYAFISIHHEIYIPVDYIEIVNIEDLLNPVYVDDFILPSGCPTVKITNDIAFIGTLVGLYVYDISDINNLVQIDWLDTGNTFALKIHNGLLHFDGRDGLTIVDYYEPSYCQILATYDHLDFQDSEIIGNTLYGAFSPFLRVIDITDPLNAYLIHAYVTIENCSSVAATGNIVYINNWFGYFNIIDVSDPQNLYLFDYYDIRSRKIAKSPDDMFMLVYGRRYEGLHFYKMDDPANPLYLYSHISHGNDWGCGDFYIDDQICCSVFGTLEEAEFYIYDLTNLQSLTITAIIEINYDDDNLKIKGIDRKDQYIYISCSTNGIMVIDISDPSNPVQVLNYDIQGFIHDLTIKDDYLYYVNIDGFYVLDISEPLQPFQVGFWDSNNRAEQFALLDHYAYIADYDGGIKVLDIIDPANLIVINTLALNSSSRIDYDPIIRDNKLFITDRHWNEIIVFDLTDPVSPVFLSSCRWDKYTNDMELFGNYLYCANDYDEYDVYGLSILDFSEFTNIEKNILPHSSSQISNLSNYPNPFNPETKIVFNLPEEGNVKLEIFNIKGQKVKTLINEVLPAEEHSTIWNVRDSNGKRVGSGIYFYKLEAGDYQKVRKMVLLK